MHDSKFGLVLCCLFQFWVILFGQGLLNYVNVILFSTVLSFTLLGTLRVVTHVEFQ